MRQSLIWANATGIGRRNSYVARVATFAGVLSTRIAQVKGRGGAGQPVPGASLPGRVFASPEDLNNQLGQWLPKANARLVRRTGARPSDLLAADKAAMLALQPFPSDTGFTSRVRWPRAYYVRMGSNDYSVRLQATCRFVDVTADLETVRISLDGTLVRAPARSWRARLTTSGPDHVEAPRALRKAFQKPHPIGETTGLRDLADNDSGVRCCRRCWAGSLTAAAEETIGQVEYYSRAMKASRIRAAATRLADQAREGGWSHEEYLAAVLSRQVAAREASGAEIRARAAGFPARNSLEDFNFDHQPGLKRDTIAHLATGAFLTEASNIVLLAPPGSGRTHLATGLGFRAIQLGHLSCSPPPSTGSASSRQPIKTADCPKIWSSCAATD